MTGSAVSTAVATTSTVSEISLITVIAVIFVVIVLLITTNSWIEPIVIMIGLGVSLMINAGSNIIFGEISFVTNAAGMVLQLAVSLDYSVFLLHRFDESRKIVHRPEGSNGGRSHQIHKLYSVQRTYYGYRISCAGSYAV